VPGSRVFGSVPFANRNAAGASTDLENVNPTAARATAKDARIEGSLLSIRGSNAEAG